MSAVQRAGALGRCFQLSTETYCLGIGFVAGAPEYALLARPMSVGAGATGDLSFAQWARHRQGLTNARRIAAETSEISDALAGVSKARLISDARNGRMTIDVPVGAKVASAIMAGYATRQEKSFWCGPATLQSIAWADRRPKVSQGVWAQRLGTSSSQGSGIGEMVRQVNLRTNWDRKVGPYIAADIKRLNADEFYWLHTIDLGRPTPGPVIEHPMLLAQYFGYLAKDHSGHFQVGRGYRTVKGTRKIKIFEVFNERDFNRNGNTTWGLKEVTADHLLRATRAHPLHNIGI